MQKNAKFCSGIINIKLKSLCLVINVFQSCPTCSLHPQHLPTRDFHLHSMGHYGIDTGGGGQIS